MSLSEHWQTLVASKRNFPQTCEWILLYFASLFYKLGVRIRNRGYDRGVFSVRKAGVPVISIGNLSLGGTGKTTLAIWCAQTIQAKGKKCAVLSRGYGRSDEGKITVLDGETDSAEHFGDEPLLIGRKAKGVPVVLGSDRFAAAQKALKRFSPDCLILDDGFQHRSLQRDLDIVCLDERTIAAPGIFPSGYLREGAEALARADFLAVKSDRKEESFMKDFEETFSRAPDLPAAFFSYRPDGLLENRTGKTLPIQALLQKPVFAFSGIAHPESFEKLLARCGAKLAGVKRFPDHHRFSERDLREIRAESERLEALPVTTEKDLMRLPKDFPVYALAVEIDWKKGREQLEQALYNTIGV